ncbi:MAG: 1-acyl-sn-glycerol-3-phosphate acyltransferase [Flavobacteriales bacterium]|jgi:1-acyl-sn-glycerol-3-phosphate acyltransferase|nr:1-acyl-sn-glycerol-3-phosphate acyltransferase [Flavobacteriales bacterium]
MPFFRKNIFGQPIFIKKLIIRFFGTFVYFRFNVVLRNKIKGAEVFQNLPEQNVLIVSNHQTYFSDVAFFYHVIYSSLNGFPNNIRFPGYVLCQKDNVYYVAAQETMKSGFLPKLLALAGAITINRSWRANGENVRRKVDRSEVQNIDKALQSGWVITFPQGTTAPYAKGRIGTAFLLKQHQPVVVPVVIDGFRRAFDKKGLKIKKRKAVLKMTVKEPLNINYDDKIEDIMSQIMDAIEQSEDYDKIEQIKKQESVVN